MFTTHYCSECGGPLRVQDGQVLDVDCRSCGAKLPLDARDRWVNVARVASLAEAGFLADELAGHGLDVRIYRAEDFSALSDRWTAYFFLQAPPRDAQAVAAHVRRHVADMEARSASAGPGSWAFDRATVDPAFWRPVALIVLAGVASFVAGQRLADQRDAGRLPPRNSLSGAVSAIGRPLVTEPAPGLPRHRLLYNGRQQTWYLDTDLNGDGRYDSRQRFHATLTGW